MHVKVSATRIVHVKVSETKLVNVKVSATRIVHEKVVATRHLARKSFTCLLDGMIITGITGVQCPTGHSILHLSLGALRFRHAIELK